MLSCFSKYIYNRHDGIAVSGEDQFLLLSFSFVYVLVVGAVLARTTQGLPYFSF